MGSTKYLPVQEIFSTIQGEARNSGLPTTFLRLFGCNLRCRYCDSGYSSSKKMARLPRERKTFKEIAHEILDFGNNNLCITGGEPLIHKDLYVFLNTLHDVFESRMGRSPSSQDLTVEIETSGSERILHPIHRKNVLLDIRYILDVKTPCSGQEHKNLFENLEIIQEKDDIVIVIATREDYLYAKNQVYPRLQGRSLPNIYLSPMNPDGEIFADEWDSEIYRSLPMWLVEDKLPNTRIQLQIHKFLSMP